MVNNILLHRKDSIILTTIDVIDEVGIHALSTREVAKRVGISEPAIFKHFKTKSDLILAVLDHYTQYDMDVIQSIRLKNLNPVRAIISYVETYAIYYENYPQITALTQSLDVLRNDPNLSIKINNLIILRTGFLEELIECASIEMKEKQINSKYLAVSIMGLIKEWCFQWRISGYSFSLKDRIMSTLEMLLFAFEFNDNKTK